MPFIPSAIQPAQASTQQTALQISPIQTPSVGLPPKKRGNLISRVFGEVQTAASKRFASVADTFRATAKGEITPVETGLQTVGTGIAALGDLFGAGGTLMTGVMDKMTDYTNPLLKAITPDFIEEKIGKTGAAAVQSATEFLNSETGKAGIEIARQGVEAYNQWKEANPRLAKNFESAVNVASIFPAERIVGVSLKAAGQGVEQALKTGAKTFGAAGRATEAAKTAVTTTAKGIAEAAPVRAATEIAEQAGAAVKRGAERLVKGAQEKAATRLLSPAERTVKRVGVAEDVVERIKTASTSTRESLGEMVTMAKDAMTNIRSKARPIQVAGQELVDVAAYVSKQMKETGKRLGAIKNRLKGVKAEIPSIKESLQADLDDLGVSISKTGKLVTDAPIEDDVLEVLSDLHKFLGKEGPIDAVNLDRLRSYLRKSFSKTGVPLQGRAQGIVEKYRSLLLDELDKIDPEYGKFAREYAEQRLSLEDFTKLLQYKGNLENITKKGLRAGEVAQRILGNAADRPQSILDALLEQARKAGYTSEKNVDDLIRFADELEAMLGTTQTRSLGGQVQRATEGVLSKIPAVGPLIEGVRELGMPNAEERLEAIIKFLEELNPKKAPKAAAPR